MSLPCLYTEDTLHIKCLGLQGRGWPSEEALLDLLNSNPEFYADLCQGKLEIDHKGRHALIVPYSKKLYDKLLTTEPFPETKERAKVAKDSFLKVTNEEVLRYGY